MQRILLVAVAMDLTTSLRDQGLAIFCHVDHDGLLQLLIHREYSAVVEEVIA